MNKKFINASDRMICMHVYKMMRYNLLSLTTAVEEKRNNTSLWNDILQYTYLGQLIDEVVEREITKEYFVAVVKVYNR